MRNEELRGRGRALITHCSLKITNWIKGAKICEESAAE